MLGDGGVIKLFLNLKESLSVPQESQLQLIEGLTVIRIWVGHVKKKWKQSRYWKLGFPVTILVSSVKPLW